MYVIFDIHSIATQWHLSYGCEVGGTYLSPRSFLLFLDIGRHYMTLSAPLNTMMSSSTTSSFPLTSLSIGRHFWNKTDIYKINN